MHSDHIILGRLAFTDMQNALKYFATDCLNLTALSNGRVSLTSTAPGSVATYSCDNGYMLIGDPTRQCQVDGSWSRVEPVCKRKFLHLNYFSICHVITFLLHNC